MELSLELSLDLSLRSQVKSTKLSLGYLRIGHKVRLAYVM